MTVSAETHPSLFEEPDRGFRYVLSEQRPLSIAVFVIGAVALVTLFVGSIVVITSYGWTPVASLLAALESTGLRVVLWVAILLGLSAAIAGWGLYRRLPTKLSREGMISGAVLGLEALVGASIFLWFLGSDLERFTRNFLDFDLLEEFAWRFVNGARNTLILSFAGITIGMLLGVVLAVFALSKRSVVRAPARVYINFFRGTPLIWQLSFMGFGIVAGLRLDLTAYQVAIIVLGLNTAAYSAEVFRSGIQSLERGQMDAARALGMTYGQSLRYVIMPQAIRRVIPPLTNEFVILIKDTSLVVVLGLTFSQKELLGVGRDIYSSTFNATAWIGSALGYLAITLPMIRVVTLLERKLRSGLTSVVG